MAFVGLSVGHLCQELSKIHVSACGQRKKSIVYAKKKKNTWETPVTEYIPTEMDFMGWTPPPLDEDEFTPIVKTAAEAADERKGRNIVALRVAKLTCVTTFFLYISGGSAPQLRAITNLVEERLKEVHGMTTRYGIPGNPASGWLLLDYGDLMVHVFSEEQRKFYDPESIWQHGEQVDLSDVVSPEGLRKPDEVMEYGLDTTDEDDDWSLS
uniref:Ribosome silencing factor n=1 Tax=Rhodosorus marinus TaxID=101924 RepID=A0A7S3EKT3_9RHOD|mmetsp:Transcript_44235/g.172248  ORF Transcript_44235/g.172248 Transcript_44235/m.172248 type:complete len:211 (+) Transcript_44235:115-747(+)